MQGSGRPKARMKSSVRWSFIVFGGQKKFINRKNKGQLQSFNKIYLIVLHLNEVVNYRLKGITKKEKNPILIPLLY